MPLALKVKKKKMGGKKPFVSLLFVLHHFSIQMLRKLQKDTKTPLLKLVLFLDSSSTWKQLSDEEENNFH